MNRTQVWKAGTAQGHFSILVKHSQARKNEKYSGEVVYILFCGSYSFKWKPFCGVRHCAH